MTLSFIEKATAHFDQKRHMEVPEFGITVYWSPLSGVERDAINRKARKAAADDSVSDSEFTYRLLVDKLEDAEGKKLLTVEDLPALRTRVAAPVLGRIAAEIIGIASPEDTEKN